MPTIKIKEDGKWIDAISVISDADTLDGKHADAFALATELNELQNLVGEKSVADQVFTLEQKVSQVLNNYYTKNDIENKNFATENYVDEAIAAIPTPDVSGQINAHNTSENAHMDIREAIPTNLSQLQSDNSHQLVSAEDKQRWDAKSNFSGSYNDLTNKPEIPSIDGLASESYVNDSLTNITWDYIGIKKEELFNDTLSGFAAGDGVLKVEPALFPLVVGLKYDVVWDGVSYNVECIEYMNQVVIGKYGSNQTENYPFGISYVNGNNRIAARNQDGELDWETDSHSITITVYSVKQVPVKYIPEHTHSDLAAAEHTHSWDELTDRPVNIEYIPTSASKTVTASESTKSVSLSPRVGYLENRRTYIHKGAIIDIYLNDELYASINCDDYTISAGTSIIYKNDAAYGDLTCTFRIDSKTRLFATAIVVPPLSEDTVVKATYKYPVVKFKDEFISDNIARKSYVNQQIAAIPTPDVSGQIDTHNTSTSAHADIRESIAANASAIELLTNGASAEEIDSVNDLIQYVNEHGGEVTGMKADIKANADAIAAKANLTHAHTISDVEGLEIELDNKLEIVTQVRYTDIILPSIGNWQSVTYGDGKFVAVRLNDKAAYSEDGTTWIETDIPHGYNWSSVTYGNGKFVAIVVRSRAAAYSEDGITWIANPMPSKLDWQSVIYVEDKFIAVASSSNLAAYSEDGITWTEITLPSSKNWKISYGNGKFVAVSTGSTTGIVACSEDGISWTENNLPSVNHWDSVAYGDGKFVVVGCGDRGTGVAIHSEDGVNWSEIIRLPIGATNVTYGKGKFVAVSNSYNPSKGITWILNSTDGVTWTSTEITLPDPDCPFDDVSFTCDRFIANNQNTIVISTDGINWTNKNAIKYPSIIQNNIEVVEDTANIIKPYLNLTTDLTTEQLTELATLLEGI